MSSSGTPQVVGAHRHGKTLVVAHAAILPNRCFKCGQPAGDKLLKKEFRWYEPWLNVLLLLGLLPALAAVAFAKRRMEVRLPLCEAHRKRRRYLLITGVVLLLGCIPAGVLVAPVVGGGWAFLVGLMLFIASLVFLVVGDRTLRPTYIGEDRATFARADGNFLLHLAEGPLPEKKTPTGKPLAAAAAVFLLLVAGGVYLNWEAIQWGRLNDAGVEAYEQGQHAEAEQEFSAAVEVAERFGENDARLAMTLHNLALTYQALGEATDAERVYRRAITIYENALGPGHPEVARTLENYAALLRDTGREDEAAELEARAQAIRAKHAAQRSKN
ncbi:MAG: tetratricopeptide repeat protein [Terriglobia bacterium]